MTETPDADSQPDTLAEIRAKVSKWPVPSESQLDAVRALRPQAPACSYIPLTGPVPSDVGPDQEFVHKRVRVGPDLAAELSATRRPGLRPVSLPTVVYFAALMTNSEWEYTPEGHLSVDIAGQLVDGLCILEAVVRSGVTIEIDVHHNYSPF